MRLQPSGSSCGGSSASTNWRCSAREFLSSIIWWPSSRNFSLLGKRTQYIAEYVYAPPQPIHFFDNGEIRSVCQSASLLSAIRVRLRKSGRLTKKAKSILACLSKGSEYKVGLHWLPIPYINELYFKTNRHSDRRERPYPADVLDGS